MKIIFSFININKMSKDNNFTENKIFKNIEYQEYYLIKENKIFRIIIGKRKNDIIFKYKNYETKLNNLELSKLLKKEFNTIEESYKFIINIFEQNKIIISEKIPNKSIKLKANIEDKEIEIILLYSKENKNILFFELNNIFNEYKNDINNLKNEVNFLREEIDKLKISNNINSDNKNKENNINFELIQIPNDFIKDSYAQFALGNTFSIFKSIEDILYLIYTNKNNSIVSFNLIDNKKILELKNAHENYITSFRYYLDNINKRDLIMSISGEDNNIKLWDFNKLECLLDIKNINKSGFLDSACFLNNNKINYIITSNIDYICSESIKVFDFKGNKVKEINNSNDITVYIDSYYDKNLDKNFILTGNYGFVKSYDFNENELYHKYCDKNNNNKSHDSMVINKCEELIKLIESSEDGNIRIWNFHSGLLLDKIKFDNYSIFGICLWNNDYLFVSCKDKTIKLIEIKTGKIIINLLGDNNYILTLKKVFLPKYGECLISQGWKNEQIKLWIKKN